MPGRSGMGPANPLIEAVMLELISKWYGIAESWITGQIAGWTGKSGSWHVGTTTFQSWSMPNWTNIWTQVQIFMGDRWFAAGGAFLALAGLALIVLFMLLRAFRAPPIQSNEAVVSQPEEQPPAPVDFGAGLTPENFYEKPPELYAFSTGVLESARRLTLRLADLTEARAVTIWLIDDSGRLVPRLRIAGGITYQGAGLADIVRIPSELESILRTSGSALISDDATRAAIPIFQPGHLAGFVIIESPIISDAFDEGRITLAAAEKEVAGFSLDLFQRNKHNRINRNQESGLYSNLRFQEDLDLACATKSDFMLILVRPLERMPQIVDFDSFRAYMCDGTIAFLGPILSEDALASRFARLMGEIGKVSIGVSVAQSDEKPDRIFDRALSALKNASEAGPNHFRIISSAA